VKGRLGPYFSEIPGGGLATDGDVTAGDDRDAPRQKDRSLTSNALPTSGTSRYWVLAALRLYFRGFRPEGRPHLEITEVDLDDEVPLGNVLDETNRRRRQ
jgi:hypothetical protein